MKSNFVVSASPLFLAFTLCSAHAEVLEGIKGSDTVPQCVSPDPVAGHTYKPGCKETIKRGAATSEMQYNAEGFRDKDYPGKPAKGWTRVLLSGSSRIAGPGLAEKETVARRLEFYLRKTSKKLEVINGGVEGYMPLNQAAKMRRWLKAYSPTHLILQVDLGSAMANDLMNAPYVVQKDNDLVIERRLLGKMKPFAFLMGLDPKIYPELRKIITWQSGVFRAVRTTYCKLFNREPLARAACVLQPTIRAIEKIYKDATIAGVKLLVLLSPGPVANDVILSPAFDPDVARRLDGFTPRLMISAGELKRILDRRGVPAQFGPPLTMASSLAGDYHLDAASADQYAKTMSLKLGSFLELEE